MRNLVLLRILTPAALLFSPWTAFSQSASLALSSNTANTGGNVTLNLSFSSPNGTPVSALEWTITSPGSVSNLSVAAGPALTAAGKTVTCAATLAGYTCIASGTNATSIASGGVAIVSAKVTGLAAANLGLSGAMASAPGGSFVPVNATGGTISLIYTPPTINSVTCSSTSLGSGAATTCTVNLTGPAGTGGLTVTLGITGPISIAINSLSLAAGASSGTFTVTAGQFSSTQSATVTASYNSSSSSSTISLANPVLVSTLKCAATTLASNGNTTCTVTLNKAAPAGGATVTVTGAMANVLTLPASVTVPANATTATFTAATGAIPSNQTATITASLNGSSQAATVSLTASLLVSSLHCTAASLVSSAGTTCTITLTKAAPTGGAVVTLAGAIANVLTLPASVTVPANASTANFTASTGAIPADQSATITASLNGASSNTTVSLVAPVLVSSLQCASSALASSGSTTCTITLTKAAPTGGAVVTLAGAIANVLTLPASVTVPAGATTATFTAKAGTIATAQTATLTASYGSSKVSASLSLQIVVPVLSSLNCSPLSIRAGASGSCTAILQNPISTETTVTLKSGNTGLQVPASVSIAAGLTKGTFRFTTSSVIQGWLSITATLGSTTKSVTLTLSVSPPTANISSPISNGMTLACPPAAQAGTDATCELRLGSSPSSPVHLRLSSSSPNVKVPAELTVRPGQYAARFKASVDLSAAPEATVLSAGSETAAAQSSLRVEAQNVPVLNVPGSQTIKVGSSLRLQLSASSADGFPVALSASQLPPTATFDETAGILAWTPSAGDVGAHDLTFTATNSVGIAASKQVRLLVASGKPHLTGLRNAADAAATAACTPGSAATLTGRFLFSGDTPVAERSGSALNLQNTKVLVNGVPRPVLFASSERVDFLCSQDAPGTQLEIALQSGDTLSNTLQTTMLSDAPGIFTLDGASGQALAFRTGTSELAALPNARFSATPAVAGEMLSVFTTGVACDENFSSGTPLLQIGFHVMPVRALKPAANYAGACELSFQIPVGITNDNLSIRLQIRHHDGTAADSNSASIAVADR